jgi:hypothetical protein
MALHGKIAQHGNAQQLFPLHGPDAFEKDLDTRHKAGHDSSTRIHSNQQISMCNPSTLPKCHAAAPSGLGLRRT